MKKAIALLLVFIMALALCGCGNSKELTAEERERIYQEVAAEKAKSEGQNNSSNDKSYDVDPKVVILDEAVVKYVDHRIDGNHLYVDFNFDNTGDSSASMHFALNITAYQDGSELSEYYGSGSAEKLLPGYNKTYTYSYILDNTKSPVLIQYSTWGISKVISEFSIELAS